MTPLVVFVTVVVFLISMLALSFRKPVFKIEKETSPSCTRFHVYQLIKIYNLIPYWERQSTEYSLKEAQTKVKELQSYKTEVVETIGRIDEKT